MVGAPSGFCAGGAPSLSADRLHRTRRVLPARGSAPDPDCVPRFRPASSASPPEHAVGAARTTDGGRPETTYVELPKEYVVAQVKLPENFQGTTLRNLDARRRFGVNVIELKRRVGSENEHRVIPGPDTELRAGDGLIVVGRPSDIAHLADPTRLTEAEETPLPPPVPAQAPQPERS